MQSASWREVCSATSARQSSVRRYLKAVSIARNLGFSLRTFTTANFDLLQLGDYRKPIGDDQIDYYYARARTSSTAHLPGGKGFSHHR